MTNKIKIISSSFLFALFIGVTDAWVDSTLFYEGSFLDLLIFDVPGSEIYMRTFFLLTMIVFGLVVANCSEKAIAKSKEKTVSDEELQNLIVSTSAIPWKVDVATLKFTYIGSQIENLRARIDA